MTFIVFLLFSLFGTCEIDSVVKEKPMTGTLSREWSVWCATYNVAMRKSTASAVEALMAPIKGVEKDVIVVGMQEVAHGETLGGSLLTWQSEVADWLAIHDGTMALVAKTYQATNQISVFLSKKLLPQLKNVQFRYSRNTLGGLTGHKGSIGVNMKMKNDVSLVFVVSHFVHDQVQYERRLAQYESNRICSFPEDKSVRSVIWMGDLNFRVEGEQTEVAEQIMKGNLSGLLQRDQLGRACTQRKIFSGYTEAPIQFPPTYRLAIGTTNYDLKRTPSWCDRILYKGTGIKCDTYSSIPEALESDHLPVQADLRIPMPAPSSSADWDVHFEHIPTWYTSVPLSVRFKLTNGFWQKRGAYMDWVGVFPNTLDDATTPLKWHSGSVDRICRLFGRMRGFIGVYLVTCYEQNSGGQKYTVAELPNLPEGEYRMGYFSSTSNCLVGLGKSFKVVETPLENL